MQLTLNGNSHTIDAASTVADLLRALKLEPIRVAVEINEEIVPRERFDQHAISSGDRVEVVTFVGGG